MKIPSLLYFFLFWVLFNLNGQLEHYPYEQGFEAPFRAGTGVMFLPDWQANEVSSGNSRVFQAGPEDAYIGEAALGILPTGSFTAEIKLFFNAAALETGEISFRARSGENGSGSRPAILIPSFSADGGESFVEAELLGDDPRFSNADSPYRKFLLPIPESVLRQPSAVLRFTVKRGEGEGTAARLFIDQFLISDEAPAFRLLTAEARDEHRVLLQFNRPLQQASAQNTSHFSIDQGVEVRKVSFDPENPQQLVLSTSLLQPELSYTLSLGPLQDRDGSSAEGQTADFRYVYRLETYDLLISEIHAAPADNTLLPEVEWVELYNASGRTLNLEGLIFADDSRNTVLPAYALPPEGYVLLAPANEAKQLEPYGPVLALTSWPSLNNSGDELSLYSPEGRLLDRVAYTQSWFGNSQKAAGGWSLERIDLNNPCAGEANWSASRANAGGTPASPNSIANSKPDLKAPELLQAYAVDALSIRVVLSEALDTTALSVSQVSLRPHIPVSSLRASQDQPGSLLIRLADPLSLSGSYELSLQNMKDCSGNLLREDQASTMVAIPRKAEPGDVVLNELMYDPLANSEEWVEIANTSNNYIMLKNWQLATYENGIQAASVLSPHELMLPPEGFLVFSRKPHEVLLAFPSAPPEYLLQLSSLPQFRNSGDSIALIDAEGVLMDLFGYSNGLHSSFLRDTKGVSLERISLLAPTNKVTNWMSAASTANYGTPGMSNSQRYQGSSQGAGELMVEPGVIMPAGDGRADYVAIHYLAAHAGLQGSLRIFDSQGRLVRTLAHHHLLGAENFFTWDGTNESGSRVRTGYYIIDFQVYGTSGKADRLQKTVVVAKDF